MQMKFDVPFQCPESIAPHLEKIFAGEYDPGVGMSGKHTVLDLGANFGSFALWAIHRWPGCEVHSYEPNPKTFEGLVINTRAHEQIKAYNFGIGKPGLRILYDGNNNPGECSFHHQMNNTLTNGQHLEVHDPMELPEADVIKLDIEGCEMEVLEPLIKAGRKFMLILLEYHNEYLRRQVDELLKDYCLIGSEVQSPVGRGVVKYIHKDIHAKAYLGA